MLSLDQRTQLVGRIRRYGFVLVRHCPPLLHADVVHLLRIAADHRYVDIRQPQGDQDWTLVDETKDAWWDILLEAVPKLIIGALPREFLDEMNSAEAHGCANDRKFLVPFFARLDEWLEKTRADLREVVDPFSGRRASEPERVAAAQEAFHALMNDVPGYRRLNEVKGENLNVRDALRMALGKIPKDFDCKSHTLALLYMELLRAAGHEKPLFLKDRDGQWRTTAERLRDLLRVGAGEWMLAGYTRKEWGARQFEDKNKGRTKRRVRRSDGTYGDVLPTLPDSSAEPPEVRIALLELRDLRDRFDDHPPIRSLLEIVLNNPRQDEFVLAARERLPGLADLMDSYKEDRPFQAALAFAFMRGGRGRAKGLGADEIADAYGASRDQVYRRGQDAERLLKERKLLD